MSWKEKIPKCPNCGDVMHDVAESESTGDYVLWCDICGTILVSSSHDPVSITDYAAPQLTKDGDLIPRRLPSQMRCK